MPFVPTPHEKEQQLQNRAQSQRFNTNYKRLKLEVVTTDPDGATVGEADELMVYNNVGSGIYTLKINTDSATAWSSIV